MKITFEELRRIKHALPTGSIHRIAEELNLDEQTIRNYFGAHNYASSPVPGWHLEPGPSGGIVHLEDTAILDLALQILNELETTPNQPESKPKDKHIVQVEEPTLLYSVPDERIAIPPLKKHPTKKTVRQIDIFKQMEALRIKLKTIPVPPDTNISQLANEVNNL